MKIVLVTVIDRMLEVTTIRRVGFAFIAVVMGIFLGAPTPAYAGDCSDNADCSPGFTCVVTRDLWLYKFRECQRTPCNADSECTRGTRCVDGRCNDSCNSTTDCPEGYRCANSQCVPKTSQPAPGHIPGEGRRCTPPNGPTATDSHGKPLHACPEGLVCSDKGFCIKLAQ